MWEFEAEGQLKHVLSTITSNSLASDWGCHLQSLTKASHFSAQYDFCLDLWHEKQQATCITSRNTRSFKKFVAHSFRSWTSQIVCADQVVSTSSVGALPAAVNWKAMLRASFQAPFKWKVSSVIQKQAAQPPDRHHRCFIPVVDDL